MVRVAKKSSTGRMTPEKVEMSLVRFSAADIRMLLGIVVILVTGMGWFVKSTVQAGVDRLSLTMATTYVSKEEAKQQTDAINQRLQDVHDSVSRIAESERQTR